MEIWQEIVADAENGAKRLVAEYGDRMFAAATLLCHGDSEAEDLVFRTFERAVRKIHQFEPTGDFFSWLYKILLNFHRMDLRKRKPDIVLVGTPQELPHVTMRGSGNGNADGRVRQAVRMLPDQIRETVVLRYFQGFSLEEIARNLAIPEGTVKSRLFTARKLLQEVLGGKSKGAEE